MIKQLLLGAALASLMLSPAAATSWNVDHARSHLGFTVQWSGEPFVASFKTWTANIDFDPDDLTHSKASVAIDLNSETSAFPDNDDGLKGPEGFSTTQFPTARFETTSFTAKGRTSYTANGRLIIHGVERQITLPFTLNITGDTAHMTGRAIVMRTDFGLGHGEWASPATIAHNVAISVDLIATKAR